MAGANPTFDGIWSQAGLAFKFANAVNLFGSSNTPNVADMEDALVTALDGAYTPQLATILRQMRRSLARPVSRAILQAMWLPVLQELCRLIGKPELTKGSPLAMLEAVRQYMVDNNEHIRARGMTLGTPSAGGVGDGILDRVTVDKDGFPLDCTGAEAKTATCKKDATSGARKGEELWTFEGAAAADDNLEWRGSSLLVQGVRTAHPASGKILRNASFDTHDASADNTAPSSTTSMSAWVLSAAASFKHRSAAGYYFATYPGAPETLWGLEIVASGTATQNVNDENAGAVFSQVAPYWVGIRWKRLASATGTLKLKLGSQEVTVDVSTGANGTWNLLKLPLDKNLYFQNFNEAALDLVITMDTLAVGTVVVDHLIVQEMVDVDGTFYLPVGGDDPFLVDDEFTWTDADGGTRAIFAFLLFLAFGREGWLPGVSPATQVTASGGRTLTFADANPDTITASSGSFISDGYKAGMTLTVAGTASNNGTFTITAVTATVITVSGALAAEGPLNATATLNAIASVAEPS